MNEQAAQKPRIVKNRDIPLLARVLYVMQDVCSLEKRCEWQRDRLFSITQHITGMPSVKGVPSGFDAAFAAIDGINEEHREQIAAYTRELKAAEKIINSIPSRTMRTFVVMMYVDGLPQEKVREELNLTEWGFRRARDSSWEAAVHYNIACPYNVGDERALCESRCSRICRETCVKCKAQWLDAEVDE